MQRRDDPRSGEGLVIRALLSGVLGGALLGMAILIPDAVDSLRPPEPGTTWAITWDALPAGALFGGLVGLASALCASIAWVFATRRWPERPRRHRIIGALGAAVPLLAPVVVTRAPILVVGVAVAAVVAYLAEPYIVYRRPDTSATVDSVISGA